MSAPQQGGGPREKAGWKDPSLEAGEIPPGAIDLRTDLPAPPNLVFQNDGSFMAAFLAASAQPAAAGGAAQASEAGTGDAQGAPADAAREAGGSAPPAAAAAAAAGGEAKKKGPLLLKPKSSIVKVRSRKGELLLPSSKKKKEEDGSKPFYLRELERYRQQSCDDTAGDRPLVK